MKKIRIKFKELFCDFCTYDIEEVLEKFPQVESYNIYRYSNTLEIFINGYRKDLIEEISRSLDSEDLKVTEVIEDKI